MWTTKVLCIVSFWLQNTHGIDVFRPDPLVYTKMGWVRGLRASDGNYSMFLGIPYAKVDEENPFGPSLPPPKFDGEFQANLDSNICAQMVEYTSNTIMGALDCLHVNIYVPHSANPTNRLPVLVWIHGGDWERGYSGIYFYGPKYLVSHNIILVTVTYRMGPYGFMCLDNPRVSGNQGLKDQLAAIRWVKENIETFDGDASRITLAGESSGGRSIDLHLLSQQEKLFNGVIMQSGTALMQDTLGDPDYTAPFKIIEQLGFTTNTLDEAISFLSGVDFKLVISAAYKIGLKFAPCVEKDFKDIEKLIADHPVNLRVSKVKNIRFLIGHNNNEQVARFAGKPPEYYDDLNIIYDRLKDNFDFEGEQLIEMEKIVKRFYLGDENISQNAMWKIIDFDSDFYYIHPTERSINMYLNEGAEKIFYYMFSYSGHRNFFKDLNNVTVGGAAHIDEMGYLFDMPFYDDPTPEDQLIIDRITSLWANFVKFRDPTPVVSDLIPVKWNPINNDTLYNFIIDTELSLGKRPFPSRMAFWDLFYKLSWRLQKGYNKRSTL